MNKLLILGVCFALTACGQSEQQEEQDTPILTQKSIKRLVPTRTVHREAWAEDIYNIMDELKIERNKQNVCSIIAIVDQESNFVANPQVPGLGAKAVKEVNTRLEEKFTDKLGDRFGKPIAQYFNNVLKNQPSVSNSYLKQMHQVKTEKDLDVLYRQIFDDMTKRYHVSLFTNTAKFVGQDIAEKMNPITTLGSMQVQVRYAQDHLKQSMNTNQLRDYLYTQYGGLYYGIHRLMMYDASYNKPIYRFADYNSGIYSSRNASFQKVLNQLTQQNLALDGDLLVYDKNEKPLSQNSDTEIALLKLFSRNNIVLTPRKIRNDLETEKEQSFESTDTYLTVQKLYKQKTGKSAPYAIMPQVIISGPKLSREYNTNWYATRVNGRYETCMHR
ncbi:DUF1615 family protein [Acinetobacter sp. HY1485]|uniref:DUF1615 family protein n=1 Tax=Acinetobacter sp. HY1485 TaxID=2970918 RepID=UPI0022B94AE7|nr:DUF1615 family protein [Acinetobacter sp. HY1485]